MGLWDKFKDLFRTEKKKDALNELYNCVHVDNSLTKLGAFERLKGFSGEAYKDLFKIEMVQSSIECSIDRHRVCDIKLSQLMNIQEDTEKKIPKMSHKEEELFISIVKEIAEIEALNKEGQEELSACDIRGKLTDRVRDKVYDEYRPGDKNRGEIITEWKEPRSQYIPPEKILLLNYGSFSPNTQFHKIGFFKNGSEKEFRMVHPAITFMLGTYNGPESSEGSEGSARKEINSGFMNVSIECYNDYYAPENKKTIDDEIREILRVNGDNMYIGTKGGTRNILC